MRAKQVAQARGRGVRIARQQQHRLGADIRIDVGAIDAGIRHDEAEPVLDDQHAWPVAHDAPRLAQNDLDQPRILVDLPRELSARADGRTCARST